jgi:hypothetical protein
LQQRCHGLLAAAGAAARAEEGVGEQQPHLRRACKRRTVLAW